MGAAVSLIDGHRMAYLEDGDGEAVVLLHGMTTASFIWAPVVPFLTPRYRVVSVDLLGCGDSDRTVDCDLSIKHQAELLLKLVDAIGLDRFHLVAHDIGGGIGQIFAVRRGERLIDLTLVNTIGYDYWPVQPFLAMRTPVLRQLAMATLDMGALRMILRRALYHKDRLTPELFDNVQAQMGTDTARKAFLHLARSLDNTHLAEVADGLRRLAMPVLVVRGDADVILPAEISDRLHRDIPGSRLVRIPTGGHFIQVDEPERLAETILDFFAWNADG